MTKTLFQLNHFRLQHKKLQASSTKGFTDVLEGWILSGFLNLYGALPIDDSSSTRFSDKAVKPTMCDMCCIIEGVRD
ncbi:hypothetical protein JTE90_024551 [Oedothorax gibbosus]|uniref:Uncharacterized protein n=1 Tax=Oedothorax gibbosus TaxID=931172 RepID=A0AAV6VC44_9ARAC|nr:hypothetical protein JTE90_024551 [Oedothorax gibbosus]